MPDGEIRTKKPVRGSAATSRPVQETAIPPKVTITQAIRAAKEKKTIRVAAYCRVSTDLDAQETSMEAQKKAYADMSEHMPGWELVGVYADEGISGTQMKKRDAFLRMMQDCRDGKIDRVVTKSISRFARNTLDCLACVRELKEIGVTVYFEEQKLDTGEESSELILSLMAAMAQEASREISNNEKWSQAKRFEEGIVKWSTVYGYRKIDGTEFIPEPTEAAVVVRIFDEYIHGKKSAEIAKGLEADGLPAPKGKHWQYSSVDSLLTNERYCGDALCQKSYVTDHLSHRRRRNTSNAMPIYYVRDHHTPIVDRNTYEMAQDIRNLRMKKGRPTQYPYGKLLACPVCGGKLERVVLDRTGSPAVWHCPPTDENGRPRGNTECCCAFVHETDIDAALRRAYAALDPEHAKIDAGGALDPEHAKTGADGALDPEHAKTGADGALDPEHAKTGADGALDLEHVKIDADGALNPEHAKTDTDGADHEDDGDGEKDKYDKKDKNDKKEQDGENDTNRAEWETAISMKRRMPELGEVHYYFLHEMVEAMEFLGWNTLRIRWKCGLESQVRMEYGSRYRIPGGEEQKKGVLCRRWREAADKRADTEPDAGAGTGTGMDKGTGAGLGMDKGAETGVGMDTGAGVRTDTGMDAGTRNADTGANISVDTGYGHRSRERAGSEGGVTDWKYT